MLRASSAINYGCARGRSRLTLTLARTLTGTLTLTLALTLTRTLTLARTPTLTLTLTLTLPTLPSCTVHLEPGWALVLKLAQSLCKTDLRATLCNHSRQLRHSAPPPHAQCT